MRFDDLPKDIQRQVSKQVGQAPKRPRGSTGSRSGGSEWECATCRARFTTWASVDRHDPSHHRIEGVLPVAD